MLITHIEPDSFKLGICIRYGLYTTLYNSMKSEVNHYLITGTQDIALPVF